MIDSLRGYISFLKSSCSEDSLKIKNSFIYVNLNHIDTAKLFLVALRINEPFIPPVCYLNLDGYNFLFSLGSRNFTSSDSLLIHNFLKTINKDLIKNIDYEVRKGTNYTRHIRITKDSINFSWRDYENPYFGSGDKLNEMIEMYRNKKKSK